MKPSTFRTLQLLHYKATGRTLLADGYYFRNEKPILDSEALSAAFKMEPEKAVAFLKSKGYAVSWSHADVSPAMHAKAFTVAKAMSADVLATIHASVTKAIKDGQTFEAFKKNLQPQLEAAGWWGRKSVSSPGGTVEDVQLGSASRLETIYRTNLQSAYMRGRWEQQKQAAGLRPYMQYLATIDEVTTPVCRDIDRKVVRIDDPGVRIPPFHFNCRTRTRTLSQRQVESMGLKVSRAEEEFKKAPPQGSFDSHPDTEWTPNPKRYPEKVAQQLVSSLASNGTTVPPPVTPKLVQERKMSSSDKAARQATLLTLLARNAPHIKNLAPIAAELEKTWSTGMQSKTLGPQELTSLVQASLPVRKTLSGVSLVDSSKGSLSLLYSISYTNPATRKLIRGGLMVEVRDGGPRFSFVEIERVGVVSKKPLSSQLFSEKERGMIIRNIREAITAFKKLYRG